MRTKREYYYLNLNDIEVNFLIIGVALCLSAKSKTLYTMTDAFIESIFSLFFKQYYI